MLVVLSRLWTLTLGAVCLPSTMSMPCPRPHPQSGPKSGLTWTMRVRPVAPDILVHSSLHIQNKAQRPSISEAQQQCNEVCDIDLSMDDVLRRGHHGGD